MVLGWGYYSLSVTVGDLKPKFERFLIMSIFKGMGGDLLREPMVILIIVGILYLVAIPLLSFFIDFWFAIFIITVMLILGWIAVSTVFKDRGKVQKGRLTNVP